VNQLLALLRKEFILEWRNKYAISGIVLYLVSTVSIVYFSKSQDKQLDVLAPAVWNILFWIVILFTSVNAIAKSFFHENEERQFYYYTITSGENIILSKIIYNFILMVVLSTIAWIVFRLMIGEVKANQTLFFFSIILGATGFSLVFTMISAIASKAANQATLMAILGFPVIIPIFMIVLSLTKAALLQKTVSDVSQQLLVLSGIDVILAGLSLVLFPYLWRD